MQLANESACTLPVILICLGAHSKEIVINLVLRDSRDVWFPKIMGESSEYKALLAIGGRLA